MSSFFEAFQGLKSLCGHRYADQFYVQKDASDQTLAMKFSAAIRMLPYGFLLSAYKLNIFKTVEVFEIVKQTILERREFEKTVEVEILQGYQKKCKSCDKKSYIYTVKFDLY